MLPQNHEKKWTMNTHRRTRRGSALIVGVVAVLLVICASVLSVLLLLNTGVATFNREKVGFVAQQAATHAATYSAYLSDTSKRQDDLNSMVNGLLENMGLRSSNTTVTVSDTTVDGKPAVSVTVTANLPIITAPAFSSVMPQRIQSTYTSVKAKAPYADQYIVGIDPFGGRVLGGQVNPTGTLPNDGQPAWSISLLGVFKIR